MSAPTSGYTVDPPTYTAPGPKKAYGATSNSQSEAEQPLLGAQQWASGSHQPRNDWDAEGSEDDIPDDFKVRRLLCLVESKRADAVSHCGATDRSDGQSELSRRSRCFRSQGVWRPLCPNCTFCYPGFTLHSKINPAHPFAARYRPRRLVHVH